MGLFDKLFKKDSSKRADYCQATVDYCRKYAKLADLKEAMENGEVLVDFNKTKLDKLIAELSKARDRFLSCQKAMGYDTGEAFLNDSAFRSFNLTHGQIQGDTEWLYAIITPWLYNFYHGISDNHFQWEVGVLLYCLNEKNK